MKRFALALGLLCSQPSAFGVALEATDYQAEEQLTEFQGSCAFQGVYATGCIEFQGDAWTSDSMQSFCQSQERPGEIAVVSAAACPKANFNGLCASKKDNGIANIFVSDMPGFICKKYLKGDLTHRPEGGW